MTVPVLQYALLSSVMLTAAPLEAQQIGSDWSPVDASEIAAPSSGANPKSANRGLSAPRLSIVPYVEASQTLVADLNAGGDVLTYSRMVAGVDASAENRWVQGQVSLRYERRIKSNERLNNQDVANGVARATVALTRNFGMDAGAIATRSGGDGRVPIFGNFVGNADNVAQVYSVYGGPTFLAQAGALQVNAAYRAGYTSVEGQSDINLPTGQRRFDQFNDSIRHVATASFGARPGVLPIGWTVSGSWKRENAGQLDSRFDARNVRSDVTLPLSLDLALVGGVGFEQLGLVERDAVRNASGVPLTGLDGRLVTDPASPYLNVYHNEGLIWDAGVSWRPSARTAFEARFGRRYGTDTYIGSFNYRPIHDWVMHVSVFDTVTGFGGLLNDSLAALPTQYRSLRNPLSGDIGGCVFGQAGGSCFNDALQNAPSAVFRQRGVAGTFSGTINGWDSALALSFNQRSFIASPRGAQAEMDGVKDDNYSALLSLGASFGPRTRFESNAYASYFNPGFAGARDMLSTGANAALSRHIVRGLSASAAVGLDHSKQEPMNSDVTASALLGLRYSF